MRYSTLLNALMIATTIAIPCSSQDSTAIASSVLINPGARSIGLGGAFAAIADDATAAFANPAGLNQILRPEISIELRGTTSRSDFQYGLDQGASGLGFFSFVYPSRRWALALYSHQLASVGFAITHTDVLSREFTVRSYAAAGAYELSDHLSLGVGISYFDGNRARATGSSGFSDADWGLNAGLLWNVSAAWNIAGFYRQGPEFETRTGFESFSFPNKYGVGFAYRPKAGALTIGFEWDHVGDTIDPLRNAYAVTDGGSEGHIGVEYAVLKWKPVVAFRAGLWRESGRHHEIVDELGTVESFFAKDRSHAAFGFGLAFRRFQVDAGVDFSDRDVIGSASFVYSF
jgi:hypothetical protein